MRWSIAWLLAVVCVGLLPGSARAASGQAQWTRVDRTYFNSEGSDVAVYETGVYMAGHADVEPCAGSLACSQVVLVRRYDAFGRLIWGRTFNLAPNPADASDTYVRSTTAAGIAVDSSGVYVTGTISSDDPIDACYPDPSEAFVRKYTHAGSPVWTRRFGFATSVDEGGCRSSAPISGSGIAVDTTGVYVTGNAQGSFPGFHNAGGNDIFLRKYTRDGALVWTRQAGTGSDEHASDVALDPWGIYIAGRTDGAWPGGINQAGDHDAFVRKYTRAGGLIWTRQFGSPQADTADSISAEGAVFYVGGRTAGVLPGQTSKGSSDAWVRKFAGNGTVLWTRQFGTSGGDSVHGLDADASRVFLTGGTSGAFPGYAARGPSDAFVTSYSSAGTRGWTRQFGTTELDHTGDWGNGVAIGPPPGDAQQDDRQGVYVTGDWGSLDDHHYTHHAFLRKHER